MSEAAVAPPPATVAVRHAGPADIPEILAIYNDAVVNTTAIWNDNTVDLAERQGWYDSRMSLGCPVLVATHNDTVLGYASYGPFRPFEGFRGSRELSVYVAATARGRGVGRLLLRALINEATARGVHVLIAGIEAGNDASIALHAAAGFVETGRMPEVGQKFGRFLDLVFMQLVLPRRD